MKILENFRENRSPVGIAYTFMEFMNKHQKSLLFCWQPYAFLVQFCLRFFKKFLEDESYCEIF